MHCPECGGEYRPGIEICPTCEVKLTEEPGVPQDSFSSRFSSHSSQRGPRLPPPFLDLVGFIDENEARVSRKRLKVAGITCELVIRDLSGPGDDGESVLGDEYWIRVPGAAFSAATDLLGLEPVLSEDACPSCGAPLQGDEDCTRCREDQDS